jgi:hypothetical protein
VVNNVTPNKVIDDELPGYLEMLLAIDRGDWPHTMDAVKWADEFLKQYPSFDYGTALAWFANAIMAGYDTAMMRSEKPPNPTGQ